MVPKVSPIFPNFTKIDQTNPYNKIPKFHASSPSLFQYSPSITLYWPGFQRISAVVLRNATRCAAKGPLLGTIRRCQARQPGAQRRRRQVQGRQKEPRAPGEWQKQEEWGCSGNRMGIKWE